MKCRLFTVLCFSAYLLYSKVIQIHTHTRVRAYSVALVISDSVTLRTVAWQTPLFIGFSEQENWSGLPCSSPGKKVKVKLLSRVRLFATPQTVAYQAPLSMGFSRQEYWSGLPFLLQGIFLTQGSNPGLPHCRQTLYCLSHQGKVISRGYSQFRNRTCISCIAVEFLTAESLGKP